jgi:beta-1,2-mannobiose phosphorylase / 1,2-beta-oligomannan phosphorylase
MKKISLPFLFFLLPFISETTVFSQIKWTKYANNPILVKTNLIWEFFAIGQPTCILENDTFKMWYCAAGIDHKGRVFYAHSTDAINWIKHNNGTPVLDVGKQGEWDMHWLDTPEIVKDSTGYKLYYFGAPIDSSPPIRAAIGLATSSDGINWQRDSNNPVLEKGDSTQWDGFWIESPAVLYDGNIYKMWYTGVAKDWKIRIGYATSPDGKVWTKYSSNPVLEVGIADSWEDFWVAVPAVIKTDTLYEMWYSGISVADKMDDVIDTVRTGYATSTDGIHWNKYFDNPILSSFDFPYDSSGPWAPDVIRDKNEYKMLYETQNGFCLATAPIQTIEEAINSRLVIDYPQLKIYPNPAITNITFCLKLNKSINKLLTIKIYDISGNLVRTISTTPKNKIIWDRKNNLNQKLTSGIYFCNLELENKVIQIQKLLLLN